MLLASGLRPISFWVAARLRQHGTLLAPKGTYPYDMLCYIVLQYGMLYYSMLCYAIL